MDTQPLNSSLAKSLSTPKSEKDDQEKKGSTEETIARDAPVIITDEGQKSTRRRTSRHEKAMHIEAALPIPEILNR